MPCAPAGAGRWSAWIPPVLAVALVAALLCLAAANVVVRAGWNELVDGVLWVDRPAGITAVEVAPGEAGDRAGIEAGDVLVALDGVLVESTRDVVEHLPCPAARRPRRLYAAASRSVAPDRLDPAAGARPDPDLLRAGGHRGLHAAGGRLGAAAAAGDAVPRSISSGSAWRSSACSPSRSRSPGSAGLGVLLGGRHRHPGPRPHPVRALRPRVPRTGARRRQEPPGTARDAHRLRPAVVLGLLQAASLAGDAASALFTTAIERLWRLELAYLAVCVVGGLALMNPDPAAGAVGDLEAPVRWIVWGAVLGGLPFVFGYAVPWSLGFDTVPLDVTAIPLSLIPLAFASAIVQYRLRDVEVIVKRRAGPYRGRVRDGRHLLRSRAFARAVFLAEPDGHSSIVALLATAVVVLLARPVKDAIESMLDRAHYRDRYDYRRALLGFARELNSDLDLDRLAERLVTRVTETLVVDHTVLMVAPLESEAGPFRPFRATGARPAGECRGWIPPPASAGRWSVRGRSCSTTRLAALRYPQAEVAFWRDQGIHYFVPCVSEEGTIAVLALGAKTSGRAVEQRGRRVAHGGRGAGRDRDRERPALYPTGRSRRPRSTGSASSTRTSSSR